MVKQGQGVGGVLKHTEVMESHISLTRHASRVTGGTRAWEHVLGPGRPSDAKLFF